VKLRLHGTPAEYQRAPSSGSLRVFTILDVSPAYPPPGRAAAPPLAETPSGESARPRRGDLSLVR
jgi:hypothetical protein